MTLQQKCWLFYLAYLLMPYLVFLFLSIALFKRLMLYAGWIVLRIAVLLQRCRTTFGTSLYYNRMKTAGFCYKFWLAVDFLVLKCCCKLHADIHTLILGFIYTWLCWTSSIYFIQISIHCLCSQLLLGVAIAVALVCSFEGNASFMGSKVCHKQTRVIVACHSKSFVILACTATSNTAAAEPLAGTSG